MKHQCNCFFLLVSILLWGITLMRPGCAVSKEFWTVPNGNGVWPITFEDKSLNDSEKAEIVQDYLDILSHLSPKGSSVLSLGERTERRMVYTSSQWRWPIVANGLVGHLIMDEQGVECALIPKALSDAYRIAIAVRNSHAEAAAILPAFINGLNNPKEAHFPSDASELFYFSKGVQPHVAKLTGISIEEFIEDYEDESFSSGSLLEWREFEGLPAFSLRMAEKTKSSVLTS